MLFVLLRYMDSDYLPLVSSHSSWTHVTCNIMVMIWKFRLATGY